MLVVRCCDDAVLFSTPPALFVVPRAQQEGHVGVSTTTTITTTTRNNRNDYLPSGASPIFACLRRARRKRRTAATTAASGTGRAGVPATAAAAHVATKKRRPRRWAELASDDGRPGTRRHGYGNGWRQRRWKRYDAAAAAAAATGNGRRWAASERFPPAAGRDGAWASSPATARRARQHAAAGKS